MAAARCQMLQAVVCDAGREAAVLQQEREHSILHCCNLASAIAVCGAMCPAVLTLYPALVDMQHRALLAVDGKVSCFGCDAGASASFLFQLPVCRLMCVTPFPMCSCAAFIQCGRHEA
jgi:hypothetical protein